MAVKLHPVLEEFIEFITSSPSLEQIVDFMLSEPAQARISELLDANRNRRLTDTLITYYTRNGDGGNPQALAQQMASETNERIVMTNDIGQVQADTTGALVGQTISVVFDNPTERQFNKGYFIRFNSRNGVTTGGGNICYAYPPNNPEYSTACTACDPDGDTFPTESCV